MTKTRSIENLQTAVSMELTAMHQYQLHAAVLDDWGLGLLATTMREEMHEELEHSNAFLARALFMNGCPELTLAKTPVPAESLQQMFESDLADEKGAIAFYTTASVQATEDGDIGARTLFERIALEEERHFSWLELQLDLLKRMGEPAYIAKHVQTSVDQS